MIKMPPKFEVLEDEAMELEAIESSEQSYERREELVRSMPRNSQTQRELAGSLAKDKFNNEQKKQRILKQIYKRNRDKLGGDAIVRGGGME